MILPAGLRCQTWTVQVPEPPSANRAGRIAAQDAYLRTQLVPWLPDLNDATRPLGRAASFHFMRYLDPGHFPGWGITFVPSFLGTATILAPVRADVEARLQEQRRVGAITRYAARAETDWDVTMLAEYGGPPLGPAFAAFLAAATRMTLQQAAGQATAPLATVTASWAHCFRLITTGMG